MTVLSYWIMIYGIPQALYCDRKNALVITREPTEAELGKGITKPKSHFGKACEKFQHVQLNPVRIRKPVFGMQENILVRNAKMRNFRRKKQVSQPGHQIVKINDSVGIKFSYFRVDDENAFSIPPNFERIINNTQPKIGLFIFGSRKKIGTVEKEYFRSELLRKKLRKFPAVTFSDQNSDNFMSVLRQHIIQGHGLRNMSPALSLNYKQKFRHCNYFKNSGQI